MLYCIASLKEIAIQYNTTTNACCNIATSRKPHNDGPSGVFARRVASGVVEMQHEVYKHTFRVDKWVFSML